MAWSHSCLSLRTPRHRPVQSYSQNPPISLTTAFKSTGMHHPPYFVPYLPRSPDLAQVVIGYSVQHNR
ncbi:uncharacterized protein BO95DRAFT_440115 [Aspergillus brunneoviolaceus CBS 621.78]|uniref:Uncharacterized protein n=1 Tax=Aspergillus brunneoviolaceus CBS 621.78 TaxID=1450534 RepID=A0ACD1GHR1_9EURO|nr:hypothetical protein BO95DRAFT_440115 [Aspergillus brunneoviolaceus CBS 621.78]RAH48631.1 hypothetical protein BO95DRAFT_440115 [Aspergillus brunneoviolaceus CBS 621.78]